MDEEAETDPDQKIQESKTEEDLKAYLSYIQEAEYTIDVMMYKITHKEIANKLVEAKRLKEKYEKE